MSKFFDNLVKKAENEYAISGPDEMDKDVKYIDTGSYALNALLSGSIYGGAHANKSMALAGEESTGKSFYALAMAKNFQDQNPEGAVMYFESEGYLDKNKSTKKILEDRGIDVSRFYVLPVTTVEEFKTQAVRIIDDYLETEEEKRKPMYMVLDSVGNLSSNKETKDTAEGKDVRDMTKTQLLKGTFRLLTLKLNRADVPLIVIGHVYQNLMAYVPTKELGGGSGLKYAASTIVFLSKSKKKDEDKKVTGSIIKVKTQKSRYTKEDMTVETLLDHTTGLNRYYGLLPIAYVGGLIERTSAKPAKYKMADGKVYEENDIYNNPDKHFTKEFLDKIDEVAGKLFKYGGSIEVVEEE